MTTALFATYSAVPLPYMNALAPTFRFPVASCSDPSAISLPTVMFDENSAPLATDSPVPEAVISTEALSCIVRMPLVLL